MNELNLIESFNTEFLANHKIKINEAKNELFLSQN